MEKRKIKINDELFQRSKLNLGCGTDYKEGWVNVDISEKDIYGNKTKVDVMHNLNKYPYPFKNEQFSYILSIGLLEHMRDLEKHIKELSRISKKGCIIKIRVPYFLSYNSGKELYTHRFSLYSIQLFNIFNRNKFRLIKKGFWMSHNKFLKWIAPLINFNNFTQNFIERFPIIIPNEVCWEFIKEE